MCKEHMRINENSKYSGSQYWSQTYVQIYVGLSAEQARYLAKTDNQRKLTEAEDTESSKIQVLNIMKIKALFDVLALTFFA